MEDSNYRAPNPRRRRKTRWQIIKEAYLPTIFLIITAILIIIFIAGSLARRQTSQETTPPEETTTSPTEDPYAALAKSLLAQANALAKDYDYDGAIALFSDFPGDIENYPELKSVLTEYQQAAANMVSWSVGDMKALSFHTLIADADRAFNDAAYGASYRKNFVTITEFEAILQQLYDNGYILVSLDDFTVRNSADSSADSVLPEFEAKELKLPIGKKPLLLVQTNVNYYTYMIDGDGDGLADKDGAGFASSLLVDSEGKLTCKMVDKDGTVTYGDYDLVPILERFIAEHADFSYQGARAILAPSGYDGIFGHRINQSVKDSMGEDYYTGQVTRARQVTEALEAAGYELACYTYNNSPYGGISTAEIQNDLHSWAIDITPVLGPTNILVFAQNSQIEEYSGSKFNVLYSSGFRYFLGFDTTSTIAGNYVRINRIMVTGSLMQDLPAQYSGLFDPRSVLDPARSDTQ